MAVIHVTEAEAARFTELIGGVILDSSVAIRAERQKVKVADLLEHIFAITGLDDVGLTSIGVTELIHGIYRAESPARANYRRDYLQALVSDLPLFNYTLEVARLAGRLDGEETMRGNIIPVPDLLIAATALANGFPLLTLNVRHFRRIPGLQVIAF